MKKLLFSIIALVFLSSVYAQTPEAFKYQAVARSTNGNVLETQNVSLRVSIQQGSTFTSVYVETHATTTNAFGLFNLEIGNGTVESGDFSTIDWSLGDYSIQIEMDETGGSNYQLMGVAPLLSVPFAMHAKTADNGFSGNYNDLTNTPDLSNYDNNVSDDFSGNYADLTNKPVLAGDVTGQTTLTKVEKIQGMDVASTVPGNGQILKWNATNMIWEPSDDALGAAGTTDGVVSSGTMSGTTTKTLTLHRTNSLGDVVITYTDEVADADADASNELQNLSLSGNNLTISNGNTIDLGVIQDGTGTDSQHITLTGTVLSIDNGNSIDLSAFMDNTDTHLTEAEVDAFVSNNGYLTSFTEVDGSITNEIQDLSLTGNTLSLSGDATTVNLAPYMDNTDAQTMSLTGTTLNISGGNSVNLSSINTNLTEAQVDTYVSNNGYLTSFTEVDGSITNEIQDLSLSGNTLSLSGDATTVNLAPYMDNTDAQNLSLSGTTLSISGGNSVNLSSIAGGTDTDDQTLSLSGTILTIADGNSVNLSSINTNLTEAQVDTYVSNNGYLTSFTEVDGSITNEIQDLSLTGNTLSLSGDATTVNLAPYMDNTDAQTMSLTGTTLNISGGNSVNLSSINTNLTEAQVDTYVSNNGYLTSEVDASTTNELQSLSLSGNSLTISSGNTVNLSSLAGTDDQTLSEVLTQGTDAGNKNITNVAKLGVGTSSVNTSAAMEVSSTTAGFLLPRMTTVQRDAISSPVAGLLVFNTTTTKFQGYSGPQVNEYDAENISTEGLTSASSTLEQTYVATRTGSLYQLQLYLGNSSTSNVSVQIYQGTTLIGTSNIVSVSGTGVQLFYFSGVTITAGTTYKYRLVAASTVSWWRSNSNYYWDGAGYVGGVAQTFDFYFRQLVTTSGGWVNLN
ncbi:MAG: hypothetical protein CVU05_08670 [Bacteroidetes bacterium HGW-Bacteroidetes-21]|jgi:ABC-type transporter Mla MlaB component|nr:MAG: hypothetical protein CVU05_08670 [Bacteroidetes bacterium HGW-Bacteroidetes-21]